MTKELLHFEESHHYEVQIWSGPEGEIDYCNDYYSYPNAIRAFNQANREKQYVRLLSVDKNGMPDGKIEKFNW